MRNDNAQNKPEDLLKRFDVDQPAGAREGGMIGAAFVESVFRKWRMPSESEARQAMPRSESMPSK